MLKEDEELWSKNLPPMIRTLLSRNRDAMADRGEWINPEKEKRKDAAHAKAKYASLCFQEYKNVHF